MIKELITCGCGNHFLLCSGRAKLLCILLDPMKEAFILLKLGEGLIKQKDEMKWNDLFYYLHEILLSCRHERNQIYYFYRQKPSYWRKDSFSYWKKDKWCIPKTKEVEIIYETNYSVMIMEKNHFSSLTRWCAKKVNETLMTTLKLRKES